MEMERKIYISVFLLFFIVTATVAQSGKMIRGVVSDSISNERIIGATIAEYDSDNRIVKGTVTDLDGNFVLNIGDPDHVFRVSYIGYRTAEFRLNGREIINILINAASIQVEEVTITAKSSVDPLTGIAERDITGSRVKIDMSSTKHIGAASADEALQGNISGVDIMSLSGDPGSGTQIVIRGLTSLGGAKPLIVVDNIPQDVIGISDFDFASADQEDIGDLVNISPQDIKSIEVLKDASTTAVWGSKGANGVLLIETFRGTRGKTRFEYQGKYTLNIQPPAIPMLNGDEYITLQLDALHNEDPYFQLPREIAYDRSYSDFYNYSANTDWLDAITRKGFINDQYVKMSGGGDKTRYFASVNYHNNTGTTENTSLNRLSTRINLDYNISDKIILSVNFNYTNSVKEDNYVLGQNVRKMAYVKAPNMSIWEYDTNGDPTGEYFTPRTSYQGNGIKFYNPVAITDLSVNDRRQDNVQNSFTLRYNILPWIRFQQIISLQYAGSKSNQFLPSTAIGATWVHPQNNLGVEVNGSNTKVLYRSQLFLAPRLKNRNHQLSATLMMENENLTGESSVTGGRNLATVNLSDPANLSQMESVATYNNQVRNMGFLGSLNYKLRDRYILSLNARVDGSSKFGINHRWGLFPSASLGWRFSKESWMEELEWISDGKIRVSWGQVGKQPANAYDRHAIFNSPGGVNSYMNQPVIVAQQVQLDNLKWETKTSLNVGIDMGLFKDRITIRADIYKDKIEDLLWKNYKIPGISGYQTLKLYNGGMMDNNGWELFTSAVLLRKNEFNWRINVNVAQNFNSFEEFPDNFNNQIGEEIGTGTYPRKINIGQPVGSFYGFRYQGVWPTDASVSAYTADGEVLRDLSGTPVRLNYRDGEHYFAGGDARYQDLNHDGVIDINDVVYLGDSNPEFSGGFGTSIVWKDLMVSAQFHFRTGFDIVNTVAMDTEGMLDKRNQSKAVLQRWTYQGQEEDGLLPRAYMDHPANNLGSSRYVEAGDFLRLNNVSIRYGLPKSVCKYLKLSSIDIAVTMRKLLTFTRYTGQDPEVPQVGDDPFWFGTDRANTPPPRAFTMSMVIEF